MPRRKSVDKNIRSLTKLSGGKSYGITLPMDVVKRWRWRERQKLQLEIDEENKEIKIKDWKK